MDKFTFSRHFEDNGESSYNSRSVDADYLPNILSAFRDFLVEAGFTYVNSVIVTTGDDGIDYSSSDDQYVEAE